MPIITKTRLRHAARRAFDASALALPDLPRNELGGRLQFALKAMAAEVMAKLITLVSAAIRVSQQSPEAQMALAKVLDTQRAIASKRPRPLESGTKKARWGGGLDVQRL